MNAIAVDIPVLETERLRLRAPSIDDLDAEAAFFQTERSKGVGGPKADWEVFRVLAGIIGHWVMRGYGFWGVDEKSSGAYVGRVGLWYPMEWPEPEIGWNAMNGHEGKGFAYEAAMAARDHAYNTLGWTTAISLILKGNDRSEALARRMGAWRDGEYDHPVHGLVPVWRHPGPEALA